MTAGAPLADVEAELRRHSRTERGRLLALCRDLIRTPSENPPGDTRAAAALIEKVLRDAGIPYEVIAPKADAPNIVATIRGERDRPHVVLNAHLDTFPVGDRGGWTVDPFGGEIRDGFLYGRGAADMRGGLASLVIAFTVLARVGRSLPGQVTLALVSEEETFGPMGAPYVLEHVPALVADAYLGAEPSGPNVLRCGEKGFAWLAVHVRTPGAHGAMLHHSVNAIRVLADIVRELDRLADIPVAMPEEARSIVESAREVVDSELGAGMSDLVVRTTVNVGTFSGGAKVNMVAGDAHAEIDVRMPIGLEPDDVVRQARRIVEAHPGASLDVIRVSQPTFSDPAHPIFDAVRTAARAVRGSEPVISVAAPATDARLWRARGVPAAILGPRPYRLGGADEHIAIDDLYDVSETHALAAYRFLASAAR